MAFVTNLVFTRKKQIFLESDFIVKVSQSPQSEVYNVDLVMRHIDGCFGTVTEFQGHHNLKKQFNYKYNQIALNSCFVIPT